MIGLKQTLRLVVASLFAVALFANTTPASAQSGSIQIEIVKAGFIVGVTGGSGTLTYKGKNYPLNIGGVSIGATIGASKAQLVGRVYNLRQPSDITGTYSAAQAGLAIAGGNKVAKLTNAKGVVLEVRGKQIGLEFSLDLSGMQISLR
jgi:hypothetical protein